MKWFAFIFLILFFLGCEKTISLQPETQKPLLVVDGTIENGATPFIILSTSLNYFSNINPQILEGSLVRNARITISDGVITSLLKEYSQQVGANYTLVYYSTDTVDLASGITGEFGKTYLLQIEINNIRYTSVTHIPVLAKTIDSLWWKPAPRNTDTNKVVLMGRFTDPLGYGNYTRYFTKVNKKPFLAGANSVFDDEVTDGTVFDFQIDQGIDRNDRPSGDNYGYFKRGDTVTVKFPNIDKATFDFWRTLEFSYQSIGNPFSTPIKVTGNVSNGALGAFCGYASQYKSLIIPK